MLNLPPTEQTSVKAQPTLAGYGVAYLLWFFTFAASLLVALAIRDLYQMALVLTAWHRYTVHVINLFATLGLILALVAIVVAVESYYRHGVQKGRLGYRFWRVFAVLSATLAVVQGLRLVLEAVASSVNPVSVMVFGLLLAIAWAARRAAQRAAPKRLRPPAAKPAGTLSRSR